MSTATEATTTAESRNYLNFDEFIDYQLGKTQSRIKTTDLLTAAVAIGAILIGYLLVFVVLDQWVVAEGLSFVPRVVMLTAVVGSVLGVLIWKLIIPAVKQVSLLYAAREIERSDANMKGSLLTLVDLKKNGRISAEQIRAAMEKRAALELSHMNVDDAVDKQALLKLSYVLLAIVVLFCAYAIFSPKRMSTSIMRALLPSADVEVATRTRIEKVDPGQTEVLLRSNLPVYCDLSGEIPQEVTLLYTTSDRRFVDEPLAMRDTGEGINRFRVTMTGENGRGILQNLTYRIVAGDAESEVYEVRVIQPPTALVDEVAFDYPDYMGLDDKVQPGGSIDAWEGTRVTVRATANMPVRNAMILFSDSEDTSIQAEEIAMDITDGTQLSATWRLELRSDGSYPRFYRIQLRNERGEQDPAPSLQPVRIREDKRPEISLIHPVADVEIPVNGTLPIAYEARDPDFQLTTVDLHFVRDREEFERIRVYEGPPFQSEARGTHEVTMQSLGAEVGQVITFWLEAKDNLVPFGTRSENRQTTQQINITIVEPVPEQEAQDQLEEQRREAQEQLDQAENRDQQAQPPQNPQQPMDPQQAPPEEQPMDPMPQDPMQQDPMQGEGQPGQEGQPQEGGEGNQGNPMAQPQNRDPMGMGDPMEQPNGNMQPGDGNNGEGSPQNMNEEGMGEAGERPQAGGDDPQNSQPQESQGQPQEGDEPMNGEAGEGANTQDGTPMSGQDGTQSDTGERAPQQGESTAQGDQSQDENWDELPEDEKLRRILERHRRQQEREQQDQLANNDPRDDAGADPTQQPDPMQGEGSQEAANSAAGSESADNPSPNETNPPSQGMSDPASNGMGQSGMNDPANPMGSDPSNPMEGGTDSDSNMGEGTSPMPGATDNGAANPEAAPMPGDGESTPMMGDPSDPMQDAGIRPDDNDPNAQPAASQGDQPMTADSGNMGDMPQEGSNQPNNTTTPSSPGEDNAGMPGTQGATPDQNPGQPGTTDNGMSENPNGGTAPMEGETPMPNDSTNQGDGGGAGMEERPGDSGQTGMTETGETGPEGQARPTDMPAGESMEQGSNPQGSEGGMGESGMTPMEGADPGGEMGNAGTEPMPESGTAGESNPIQNPTSRPESGEPNATDPMDPANPMEGDPGNSGAGSPQMSDPMNPSSNGAGDGMSDPNGSPSETGSPGGMNEMSEGGMPSENGMGSPGQPNENGEQPSDGGAPSEGQSGMGESGMGQNGESGMGETGEPTMGESGMGEGQQSMGEGQSGMGESAEGQNGMGEQGMGESGQGQSGMGESQGQQGMGQEGAGQQGMDEGQQGMGEGQGQSGMGQGEPGMGQGGGEGQDEESSSGSSDTNNTGNPASGLHNNSIQNGSTEPGQVTDNAVPADEANLDNLERSTSLALQQLMEDLERGEVTEEELQNLGATPEQLRRFAEAKERDLANINNPDLDDPEAIQRARQFETLLREMGIELQSEGDVREAGDTIDVDASGFGAQRRSTPSEYRSEEEAYRQRLLRQQD